MYPNQSDFGIRYGEKYDSLTLIHKDGYFTGELTCSTSLWMFKFTYLNSETRDVWSLGVNFTDADDVELNKMYNMPINTGVPSNVRDEAVKAANLSLQLILMKTEEFLLNSQYCIHDLGFTKFMNPCMHEFVSAISLNKSSETIKVGKTVKLSAVVSPSTALEYNTLTWKSSNESVATVSSSGLVTAVKPGSATITATAGGKSARCTVKVEVEDHEHTWGDVKITNPTCGEDGREVRPCTYQYCTATDVKLIPATGEHSPNGVTECTRDDTCRVCRQVVRKAKNHTPTYTADGAVLKQTCANCTYHNAWLELSATGAIYSSEAIETASMKESGRSWIGEKPSIVYTNNVNAGIATASITCNGVTASVDFEIAKRDKYGLSFDKLKVNEANPEPVKALLSISDPSAVVVVEFLAEAPEVACAHEHSTACGFETNGVCEHKHDKDCGYLPAGVRWTSVQPTKVGSYQVRGYLSASDNLVVSETPEYINGTLYITGNDDSNGGNSSSSSSSFGGGGGSSGGVSKVTVTSTPTEEEKPEQNPEKPNEQKIKFADIAEGAWFGQAVEYAVEKGLMNGVSESRFAPNATLTRGMVITVLARLAGVDTTGGSTWYEKAMAWAISEGVSDGSAPEANITREQLATMLFRFADAVAGENTLLTYDDACDVSEYAVDAIQWAVEQGLVTGMNESTLNPKGQATRAQFATILMRYCESVK